MVFNFQQYFSYIMAVSFIGVPREKQVTDKLYRIMNVVSTTLHLNGIQTHIVSGDRH
jgi:hypothetical protein